MSLPIFKVFLSVYLLVSRTVYQILTNSLISYLYKSNLLEYATYFILLTSDAIISTV